MAILISAANSDISDSLCRIYKESFPDRKVVGMAPDGLWPAQTVFDKVYSIKYANDHKYLPLLLDIIKKEKISIFVPVSENELRFIIAKNVQWPAKVKVLMNPQEVLLTCLDKQKTFYWLNKIEVDCPKTLSLDQVKELDLPVFIKGRESAGSKNTYIVHTWDLYIGLLKEFEYANIPYNQMIAQHYLDSNLEYTCAISKIDNISNYIILKRKLASGITVKAKISHDVKIKSILEKISSNIAGNCFINVQLRVVDATPMIFEINPRFSSTVMLRHMVGFRDFIWHLDWLEQAKKPPLTKKFNYKNMYRINREVVI